MTAQEQKAYETLLAERALIDKALRDTRLREQRAFQASPSYEKLQEKADQRFAKRMGFRDPSPQVLDILREGRSAFDYHYNARLHGKSVSMGRDELGTLPQA